MSLTKDQVTILTRRFDDATLGVKVQSFSKDKTRASLVLYLQHTDVAARLDEVDPSWEFKVLNEWPHGDSYYYVKASLTLCGVTRENIGEGNEPKGAYSDALKRCAMLFGIGRHLYDSEVVWVLYNESKDRYKVWTIEEYNRLLSPKQLDEIKHICELCSTYLVFSENKRVWFCPNFKEQSKGKHTVINDNSFSGPDSGDVVNIK
jgi:hypothetical protein